MSNCNSIAVSCAVCVLRSRQQHKSECFALCAQLLQVKIDMRTVSGSWLLLAGLALAWGRIADEKCEEYANAFRRRRDITSFILDFFHVPTPEKVATQPGEFPHMAHLGFGEESDITFACGGTLVSDQFILTTATCTTVDVLFLHSRRRRAMKAEHKSELDEDPEEPEKLENPDETEDDDEDPGEPSLKIPRNSTIKWVQFGDRDSPLYQVDDIIIHPDHTSPGLYNDIALIKLDRKVEFSQNLHPACLYIEEDDLTNRTVIATGYGSLAFDQDLSDDLMKIPLTVLTEEECNKGGAVILYLNEGLSDNQLCVGGRDTSNTLCQGDGGGPLQIKNEEYKDMYNVVGLISFGYMCNVLSFPVYATRVSSFVPWIESIVWHLR